MDHMDQVRNCLCLHTRRSARVLTQFYDAAMRPSGLRVTQFTLLSGIEEMQAVTQQALADFMGMDRTTLTRNLAVLMDAGLVQIASGEKDRRQNRISLTAAGRDAVARAVPLWRAAQLELVHRLEGTESRLTAAETLKAMDALSELVTK